MIVTRFGMMMCMMDMGMMTMPKPLCASAKNRRKSAGSAKNVLCKYQLYFEPA